MTSIEGYSLSLPYTERAETAAGLAAPDLAALVEQYSPLLFRVAHSILRNASEAEDVVQDAFVRVLEHRRDLPAVREMRVWLVRIAWNLALDRRRRIWPEQMDERFAVELVSRSVPADQMVEESRRVRAVLAEIERLPGKERHVLLLAAVEELDTAEMAAVLGRSDSAVRALLFRARSRLRERLEKGGL